MRVMLLAAGRSTRLGRLGAELPKPLVPICGYPAIRFGMEACRRAGFRDVVVNLFHHADAVRRVIGDGSAFGLSVAASREADLLGTGGGLVAARPLLGVGPVLVMNAKVVADVDLRAVVAAHAAGAARGALATLVLRDDPEPRRWGPVAVDATGRIVGILDARSPRAPEGPVIERMFTGIHVVEPALLDRLPPGVSDVVRDGYIPALLGGGGLGAVRLPGYFAEHSTPARYLAGNLDLLAAPELLPSPPGPLTGIAPTAAVAATARLSAPYRLADGAEIGAGAEVACAVVAGRVAPGARVSRSVVWPGAVADGVVEDAVVTPAGTVKVA